MLSSSNTVIGFMIKVIAIIILCKFLLRIFNVMSSLEI